MSEALQRSTQASPHSTRRRLWAVLQDGELHSWRELFEIAGVRYHARITELRRLGYQIATHLELDASGGWYRFIGRTVPRERRIQFSLTVSQAQALVETEIPDDIKQLVLGRLESHSLNGRREDEASRTDRFAPIEAEERHGL